jgi:hypothetical protein
MYDQLKAIYGDDLDIMIKVMNDTSYRDIPQLNGKRNKLFSHLTPRSYYMIVSMLSLGVIGSATLFILTIGGDLLG